MKQAEYWHTDGGVVVCDLCPHRCRLAEGRAGLCRSRRNHDGILYSEVYGRPCSLAVDPIEKKPLYHFMPGTRCLSMACTGCNLRCLHCQNHDISQARPGEVEAGDHVLPADYVRYCRSHSIPTIAYTYTEPLTYLEYVRDIAREARGAGLKNVLVSAGYVNPQPLGDLLPYLDAANIDLKYFSDELYRKQSGATLQPVLDTLLALKGAGVWLEITCLVIPGVNDGEDMMRQMCAWLRGAGLGDCPLHLNRFFPRYRMTHVPPTPAATLQSLAAAARDEGIRYVYIGNV